ncbi:MAG: ferredoxin [Saprospirales bacterium]|nr:ferredoxin [Saprospirales bacterium]
MIIITLQRDKCIGCNYCAELAPEFFRMSKKDGKCTLLHAVEKKGFHTARTPFEHAEEPLRAAEKVCPVKIIKIKPL